MMVKRGVQSGSRVAAATWATLMLAGWSGGGTIPAAQADALGWADGIWMVRTSWQAVREGSSPTASDAFKPDLVSVETTPSGNSSSPGAVSRPVVTWSQNRPTTTVPTRFNAEAPAAPPRAFAFRQPEIVPPDPIVAPTHFYSLPPRLPVPSPPPSLPSAPTNPGPSFSSTTNLLRRSDYDAFINFSSGPYAFADSLTVGTPGPWYQSPAITRFFQGQPPDPATQRQLIDQILSKVEGVYTRSFERYAPEGVSVPELELTINPNDFTRRSLSVVSGASYGPIPSAVGIAHTGFHGFTFVDKFTQPQTLDELITALSNNIAHELMHVFGVDHHDTTGLYLDSGITSWEVITDPEAVFGPEAVADLLSRDFRSVSHRPGVRLGQEIGDRPSCALGNTCSLHGGGWTEILPQDAVQAQILAAPVPEPHAILVWTLSGGALAILAARRRTNRA